MADPSEVDKLKSRIGELEQQLTEEREEFEWDLKAAKETSTQTIQKLEKEIARLKRGGGAVRGGKRASADDVEMLTQRALMAERRVAELQEELKRASNLAPRSAPREDPLLRQRAEAAEAERDELRKDKRAVERSLEEKKVALKRARDELEEAKGAKRELEGLRAEFASLEKEVKAARSSSAGAVEEKDQKIRELAQELNTLAAIEAERDQLTADLRASRKTIEKLTADNERLKKDQGTIATTREQELENRAVQAEEELNRLNQELAQVKIASGQMLEQREREAERLRTDLQEVTDRQGLASQQSEGLNRELDRLRTELAVVTSERDELVAQIRSLRDRETVVTRTPGQTGDQAAASGEIRDLFDERTQKASLPRGAEGPHPAATSPGVVEDFHEGAMSVVTGEVVERAVTRAEDPFLEDETTKKTEAPKFTPGGGRTLAGVPPPPDQGSASEEELAPPAVDSVSLGAPGGGQEADGEDVLEPAPELEVSPGAEESWMQGGEAGASRGVATRSEGKEYHPVRTLPTAEPLGSKPGRRKRVWFTALAIGVVFGIVVVGALHFFPIWFGVEGIETAGGDARAGGTDGGSGTIPAVGAGDEGVGADAGAAVAAGADGQAPDAAVVAAAGTGPEDDPGDEGGEGEGPGPTAEGPGPELLKAHEVGARLLKRKKYVKALKFVEGWLEKHPDDPTLRYLRGRSLFYRRKHKQAAAELERAVELDPGFADAYYELGGVYLFLKQRGQACEAMKAFVRLSQDGRRVRGVMGNIKKLRCP